MGLFSWLFGRKKQENTDGEQESRHFCEEKVPQSRGKRDAETSPERPEPTQEADEANYDETEGERIVLEGEAKHVKLRGYSVQALVRRQTSHNSYKAYP